MTKFGYKVATGVITASFFVAVLAPAASAATITVNKNGALSHNKVVVKKAKTTAVMQSSKTSAKTSVKNTASTGGNNSSFNTGGTSEIKTGDATNTTTVTVMGGSNTATLPSDCDVCEEGVSDIKVSGNGAMSSNTVKVVNSTTTVVEQSSDTCVVTNVDSSAKTGNNTSSFNTGGDSSIDTGDADNTTSVTVTGGSNAVN